jgi:hypothetical protein
MLLVIASSIAGFRHGVLPRWLAWAGFPAAPLFPLAVGFGGFLVLALWVLAASVVPARGRRPAPADAPNDAPA